MVRRSPSARPHLIHLTVSGLLWVGATPDSTAVEGQLMQRTTVLGGGPQPRTAARGRRGRARRPCAEAAERAR